jgi:hypothetical protein
MAWPAATPTASYDKLAGTFDVSIDQKLWPALMNRSPLLAYLGSPFKVDEVEFKWETQVEHTYKYTEANSSDTDIDGHATNTAVKFTSVEGLSEGALIRNASRATPIGTYGADEIMQITAITGTVCTVTRDYAQQNSGTGSTAHALQDVFEVIATPREEGSSPGANRYKDVVLASNFVQSFDFYVEVTNDQLLSKRMVAGDTFQAQVQLGLRRLQNEMEKTALYGALNNGANAGSDSYVRSTKGFQNFVYVAGANVDYTTKAVTAPALDAVFADIITDNTDETDKFIIVCNPATARVISHFGEDTVRTTQSETVWGREIQTFKSDLGIMADIIWTNNCSKSDLFIIDVNKMSIAEFEPWKTAVLDYEDDQVDSYRSRTLGKYGFKVVDATKSHGALAYLEW